MTPRSEDENITVSAGGRAPIEVSALPQQWSFGRLSTGHLAKGGFFLRELLPDQQAILVDSYIFLCSFDARKTARLQSVSATDALTRVLA